MGCDRESVKDTETSKCMVVRLSGNPGPTVVFQEQRAGAGVRLQVDLDPCSEGSGSHGRFRAEGEVI